MSEVAAHHVEEAVEWTRKETATSAWPESDDTGTETGGVYQLLGSAYGASIWDPSNRTQVWLGTFHTAEDASTACAAAAANLRRPRARRKDAASARPEPAGARTRIRGVHHLRSGAYGSSIRDRVWLGSSRTAEDAARAYAAAMLPAGASKFRGVSRVTGTHSGSRYRARITHSKGTQLWLGTFGSAEEAARAYDAAAVKMHGDRAFTNFGPDGGVVLGTRKHQQEDLSTEEWRRVHELLKDMDSTHDKDALIDAAAILHQMAQAGHAPRTRGEPT